MALPGVRCLSLAMKPLNVVELLLPEKTSKYTNPRFELMAPIRVMDEPLLSGKTKA